MENGCLTVKLDPKFLESRLESSVIFDKMKGLYYVKMLGIRSNNVIWIQLNPHSDLKGSHLAWQKNITSKSTKSLPPKLVMQSAPSMHC